MHRGQPAEVAEKLGSPVRSATATTASPRRAGDAPGPAARSPAQRRSPGDRRRSPAADPGSTSGAGLPTRDVGYPACSPRQRRRRVHRGDAMDLLLLTAARGDHRGAARARPAGPQGAVLPLERRLLDRPGDVVLVDARRELAQARTCAACCTPPGSAARCSPWSPRAAWSRCHADWGVDDVILATAGPAEIEARLLAAAAGWPRHRRRRRRGGVIRAGELTIDEHTYAAEAQGPPARPDLQGVRAAEVPGPAPGPGVHPRPAAARGLGLRLLRRHPHGRRPRPAAARQARLRARVDDRHRAQVGYKFDQQAADADRRSRRRAGSAAAERGRDELVRRPRSPRRARPRPRWPRSSR